MSSCIQLRSATLADVHQLEALAVSCAGAPVWSADVWQQTIGSAHGPMCRRIVLLATLDEALVGFAVLHSVAGEGEIETLGVAASKRRCGIGRTMCEALLLGAAAAAVDSLRLEVRESNLAALRLYRSLGFELEGRRSHYYQRPVEDALLLVKHLKVAPL